MREINDLLDYWKTTPPAHVGVCQLRAYVMAKLGDRPPEFSETKKMATAEEFAAALGLKLPAKPEVSGG